MYAIIETGGKQYKVAEGDVVHVEKLGAAEGDQVTLDKVLMVAKEGGLLIGKPYVGDAKVVASVVKNDKAKKILVFKYKNKINYRKRYGHRQPYTALKIEKIEA